MKKDKTNRDKFTICEIFDFQAKRGYKNKGILENAFIERGDST